MITGVLPTINHQPLWSLCSFQGEGGCSFFMSPPLSFWVSQTFSWSQFSSRSTLQGSMVNHPSPETPWKMKTARLQPTYKSHQITHEKKGKSSEPNLHDYMQNVNLQGCIATLCWSFSRKSGHPGCSWMLITISTAQTTKNSVDRPRFCVCFCKNEATGFKWLEQKWVGWGMSR